MKLIKILIVAVILFSVNTHPQEKPARDKENLESLKDSLEILRNELKQLKESIGTEIFRLRKTRDSLDIRILREQRELYIMKYGNEDGSKVASGMVWKGMTEEMLEDSWGKPDKIESNKQPYGVFNQWYYGDIIYFFRDGKLIDWEEGSEDQE